MRRITVFIKFVLLSVSMVATFASAQTFQLNSDGYFNAGGTDVMAFSDFYPEGHQGGVCVIMNGHRIVTTLCYPDSSRHMTGFNPMVYPEWHVNFTVTVEPQGKSIPPSMRRGEHPAFMNFIR